MKPKLFLVLFLIGIGSCKSDIKEEQYFIKELHVGYSNIDAFKEDKKDSFFYLQPPPPPFEGDIANNAFIEGKSGKVYFYYFPEKQKLCGFMTENGKYKLELYKTDLDSLKAKDLRLIEAKDIIEITNKITLTSKPSYISIGIENDSTSNPILTKIATRLYKFSNKSTWKVRKLNNKEIELVNEQSIN